MRRAMIYSGLLAAALLLPSGGKELGKIKPVETLLIKAEKGQIILRTDTEDLGIGNTVEEAMCDLEKTTAGRIYPDTTLYLLVDETAEENIEALKAYLKGSTRLCIVEGDVDLQEAGEYLGTHKPGIKLKKWKKGGSLQHLRNYRGKMKIN